MNETVRDTTALALIQIPEDRMALFCGEYETIEALLAPIKRMVEEFTAYPATEEGRAAIKSFNHKLARIKTALDDAGKTVNADLKALPGKIDAKRRQAKATFEGWQNQVYGPLEAWENAEKDRIDKHVKTIGDIRSLGEGELRMLTVDEIAIRMGQVDFLGPKDESGAAEFADEYRRCQRIALELLGAALVARRRYDADQAELAALRKAQAERDAKDAAEQVAREAKEAAERAAHEQADRDREATARAEREAADAAQRAADKIESDAREAAAKLEHDRLAAELAAAEAERRRLETEARVRRESDEAAAETARIEADKKKATEEAEAARITDLEHQRAVNRAIVDALIEILGSGAGRDLETSAKAIVSAISTGRIPRLTIQY